MIASQRSKSIKLGVYSVLVLTCLIFGATYCSHLLRAASVLYSFATKADPLVVRLYTRFFGFASSMDDITIAGSSGPIALRVYSPLGRVNAPTMVIAHGFVAEGNRHPILNLLAKRLARTGLRVVLPTLPAETHYQMKVSDLVTIEDTIDWSAKTSGQTVSVMGVSFGAGLALSAAAQPAVVHEVKVIIPISGYNNLDTIGHYYIHDKVKDPSGMDYPGHGPPAGPLLFISQYLNEIVSAEDAAALQVPLELFKGHAADHLTKEALQAVSSLSPRQRSLLADMQAVRSPEMRSKYVNILERHKDEIAAISPSSVLPTLHTPLYVIHGLDDPAIPVAEIEWMKVESKGNADAHFCVSSWLGHSYLGVPSRFFEKVYLGIFFNQALSLALDRQAL